MKITQSPSPNFTRADDPDWGRIDTSIIVVHATAGSNSLAWLRNPSSKVSAHYLVSKDGTIHQLVQEKDVAWHAGKSSWGGRTSINRHSIGIEVENLNDGKDPYPDAQIRAVVDLSNSIRLRHNITSDNVVAHYDISPGRKTDPVGFNMSLVRKVLTETITGGTIMNGPQVDSIKLYRALNTYANHLSAQEKEQIVSAFTTFGELTTIGNLYPFAQWCHETGYGTSERWVKSRNSAGLGATNDGSWGGHFNSISEGILAQYAHLLCYATKPEDNTFLLEKVALLSPRYAALAATHGRGCAKTWLDLNGKWAVPGRTYGDSILRKGDMILEL